MTTSYTTRASLAKPQVADRGWDVPLNANADALDGMAAVGSLCVVPAETPSASLNVRVAAGTYRKSDGTAGSYAGAGPVALPASAVTRLWLDDGGTLTTGPAFPSGADVVRLAVVTTGPAAVASVADARTPWFSFGASGGGGSGTVSSVALTAPAGFGVTGSPVTGSGTLAITFGLGGLLAGTGTGVRDATAADLPVMGPSGPSHAPGAVPDPGPTPGTDRYLREDGSWVSPPGGGAGAGSVTSVGLALPADWTVTGAPVTGAGVLTAARASQAANLFLASPAAGAAAPPAYRAITPADLPPLGPSGPTHQAGAVPDPGATAGTTRYLREDGAWQVPGFVAFIGSGPSHAPGAVPDPGPTAGSTRFLREDGSWSTVPSGAGGTVTSVGLGLPAELTVTGSPVTGAGTLSAAWASAAQHAVFAGPAGSAGTPAFRALLAGDLPTAGLRIDSHYGTVTADADATTVTFDLGVSDKHSVTLGGNRTLAFTGGFVGQSVLLVLKQDGTGGRTVAGWPSGVVWPGGSAPTLTAAAGKADVVGFLCTGSGVYLGFVMGQNY